VFTNAFIFFGLYIIVTKKGSLKIYLIPISNNNKFAIPFSCIMYNPLYFIKQSCLSSALGSLGKQNFYL